MPGVSASSAGAAGLGSDDGICSGIISLPGGWGWPSLIAAPGSAVVSSRANTALKSSLSDPLAGAVSRVTGVALISGGIADAGIGRFCIRVPRCLLAVTESSNRRASLSSVP